jgi:hypothetical protein
MRAPVIDGPINGDEDGVVHRSVRAGWQPRFKGCSLIWADAAVITTDENGGLGP